MIPIVVVLMIAVFCACLTVAIKTAKAKIINLVISVAVIVAMFAICIIGFSNVTKDSHVVAQITVSEQDKDLFYDSEQDVYFYTKAENWKIFYPQYRVVVDHDVAEQYVKQYNDLQNFDFSIYESN